MAHRRPEPEGFNEKLDRLDRLEARRQQIQREIDDVFLWLTVEHVSPTETIAERLKVTTQSVASRRRAALRRREQRVDATQDKRAA
jgi:hypothetical protein